MKNEIKLFSADVLYVGEDEKENWSVAVEGNRIKCVGLRSEIMEQFPGALEIELDGYLYPAFNDAHVHAAGLAYLLGSVDATEIFSMTELLKTVESVDKDEVFVYNFDFNGVAIEEFSDLFDYTKKAVFVQSKDEHSIFLNRVMIEKRGIQLRDIVGGELVKVNGKFVGIFKDNAITLIEDVVNRDVSEDDLRKVEDYFLKRGITSITNMDFSVYRLFEKMALNDELKLRVYQAIFKDSLNSVVKEGIYTGMGNEHFRWGPVKCFMDGSLGSQTAYMYGGKGLLTMSEEEFTEIVRFANRNDIQVAVHAIGDLAVHMALNLLKRHGRANMRNRVEHLQFVNERDMYLVKETPFVPSMQPVHAISDANLVERYLGGYRYAYAWRSVMSLGKILAFGSDAPVEDPSPALGIYAATTRKPFITGKVFLPEEIIDFSSAVKWYTYGSAYASFMEKNIGRIESGYIADMMLLDKSLAVPDAKVESIIVDGKKYEIANHT